MQDVDCLGMSVTNVHICISGINVTVTNIRPQMRHNLPESGASKQQRTLESACACVFV